MSESVASCNLCGKIFIDEYDLEWHIRKQHTYWCYKCSTTFYTEDWDSNYYTVDTSQNARTLNGIYRVSKQHKV